MADGCRTRSLRTSFLTSLPDVSEVGMSVPAWKQWFVDTAMLALNRCSDEGVCIFFQSDIKSEGQWVDKSYLCLKAAEAVGSALLWRKVVCRCDPGTVTMGRPSFSHLLCFSRGVRDDVKDIRNCSPDVLPVCTQGWVRGMGLEAALLACQYISNSTSTRTVVAPFCGIGTALAVANSLGLDAIGVEISGRRVSRARMSEYRNGQLIFPGSRREMAFANKSSSKARRRARGLGGEREEDHN